MHYRVVILQTGRIADRVQPDDVCMQFDTDPNLLLPAVQLPASDIITSFSEPVSRYILILTSRDQKLKAENTNTIVYKKITESKRKIKITTLCEYLFQKIAHCKSSENKELTNKTTYQCTVTANLEWLISVIETEMDYHLGKRICAKKSNAHYMDEYKSTQITGFGAKFYDRDCPVSKSIIAQLYPMNCK